MDVVQITLFLWYMTAVASEAPLGKPNCSSQCGSVTQIPYPFGIEAGCYLDDWFQIICDNSASPPRAFLNVTGLEVLEISVEGTLKVESPITFSNCSNKPVGRQTPNLEGSPFVFSLKNRFTSLSCGRIALMTSLDGSTIAGCLSICDDSSTGYLRTKSCTGMNCCQTTITPYLRSFNTSFGAALNADRKACKSAFLVEHDWFTSNSTNVSAIDEMEYVPMVLEWHVLDLNYTKFDIYGTKIGRMIKVRIAAAANVSAQRATMETRIFFMDVKTSMNARIQTTLIDVVPAFASIILGGLTVNCLINDHHGLL
ncbi:wall-associated receptor kinase-like 8 [Prunus yedoensis var. nudiflora]|uniref:Wall-associated receptor kinase-like 8 n=1 Tax=Prunus yedoensis var. nudiflora TaxID=2094558 RepID=A0A314ZM90_PRUYE|nr:wall-associated receptor kinase-like 8 [Prunus yedoensis var. nudiflora]